MAAKQRVAAGRKGPVLVSEVSTRQRMTAVLLVQENSPTVSSRRPKLLLAGL